MWAIWIPAQLVSFCLVAPHLRVAYSGAVGTLWVIALSMNTKLLATMGDACAVGDTGPKCSVTPVADNPLEPVAKRGESAGIEKSGLAAMIAQNWAFVMSFYVLQLATGTMFAAGFLWLSLLLWAGLS